MNKTLLKTKEIKITINDIAKELGGVLRLEGTINILLSLAEEPKMYTELEKIIKLSHATFIRRLNELLKLRLIKKVPITSKRRETHLYTLDRGGKKLLSIILSFDKYPIPAETQKIIDTFDIK